MSGAVHAAAAAGEKPGDDGLAWRSAYEHPFQLLGFKWFEENGRVYCRLPKAPRVPVRKPVMSLAHHTAGGQVRFRTDSRRVVVRAQLAGFGNMDHMARTGQDGFDLYVGPAGRERFVAVTRVSGPDIKATLFRSGVREMREFRLNFPLYCGVRTVEIGLESGARVEAPAPLESPGCIVVYGTSITQGGCAARPGMAYTNILSRDLNREVVNLGFSGNGMGEIELAQLISDIPGKDLVILDYEANANDGVRKTLGPFVDVLRAAAPRLPILVVSKVRYAEESIDPGALKRREDLRRFQREFVAARRAAGDARIFFADGAMLLGDNWWECSVDGHHQTTLGFERMAKALGAAVEEILLRERFAASPENVVTLWPGGNPGGWKDPAPEEKTRDAGSGITRVRHVNTPELLVYRPDRHRANGIGVLICPGGGYSILAIDHEGHDIARRCAAAGFAAFVLKYRLPRPGTDDVRYLPGLQDAQRALSLIRARAGQWGVRKLGIMGFSAGAHLAAVTATHWRKRTYAAVDAVDKQSCRPDSVGLIYPAYLVKGAESGELADEVRIPPNMPAVFLVQTEDDSIRVENSIFFYRALKENNVRAEMHLYAEGGHGYGLRAPERPVGAWIELYLEWLARQ